LGEPFIAYLGSKWLGLGLNTALQGGFNWSAQHIHNRIQSSDQRFKLITSIAGVTRRSA
jgi:hypothetical protein